MASSYWLLRTQQGRVIIPSPSSHDPARSSARLRMSASGARVLSSVLDALSCPCLSGMVPGYHQRGVLFRGSRAFARLSLRPVLGKEQRGDHYEGSHYEDGVGRRVYVSVTVDQEQPREEFAE